MLSTGLSSQDFAGDDKTILQAESARGSINRPRIGGGKGISQQVSLVPFSVVKFRVADDSGVGPLDKGRTDNRG